MTPPDPEPDPEPGLPASRPLTVATYNAGDRGQAPEATFVAWQETPLSVPRTLPNRYSHRDFHGSLAISWDTHRFRLVEANERRFHGGRAKVTPSRFVCSVAGVLDGTYAVAVVNTHLINNAWGVDRRGERRFRRAMWWRGWRAVRREVKRLRRAGYHVFEAGDFNRRERYWRGLTRELGDGYDRLRYPNTADVRSWWRGRARGSDHRPIVGEFVIRSERAQRRRTRRRRNRRSKS